MRHRLRARRYHKRIIRENRLLARPRQGLGQIEFVPFFRHDVLQYERSTGLDVATLLRALRDPCLGHNWRATAHGAEELVGAVHLVCDQDGAHVGQVDQSGACESYGCA